MRRKKKDSIRCINSEVDEEGDLADDLNQTEGCNDVFRETGLQMSEEETTDGNISFEDMTIKSLCSQDSVERKMENKVHRPSESTELGYGNNIQESVNLDVGTGEDLSSVTDNCWYSVKARRVEGGLREFVFVCKVCGKLCHRRGNMDDHVRSHAGIKPFQCQMCGNKFSRKQNLKSHFSKIHRLSLAEMNDLLMEVDLPPPAVDCRQIRHQLNSSEMSDDSSNRIQTVDEEAESSYTNPQLNERGTVASRKVVPDITMLKSEEIFSVNNYNQKLADNHKAEPHTALEDTAEFDGNNDNIDRDLITKTGYKLVEDYGTFTCLAPKDGTPAKIYHCKTCKYECVRRYTMRAHTLTHTGVKRYFCEVCGSAFTRNTYLKIHLSRAHDITGIELDDAVRKASETAPSGVFTSPWTHEFIQLGNKLQAKSQLEATDLQNDAGTDVDTTNTNGSNDKNNYSDSKTESFCRNDENLETVHDYGRFIGIEVADNITHSKIYRCKVCSYECTRRYTMKTHAWTHTGFKRYCCIFCGNSFTRTTYFRFHLRKAHSLTGVTLDTVVREASEQSNVNIPLSLGEKNEITDTDNGKDLKPGESESFHLDGEIKYGPVLENINSKSSNLKSGQVVADSFDHVASYRKEFKESIATSADSDTDVESDATVEFDVTSFSDTKQIVNKGLYDAKSKINLVEDFHMVGNATEENAKSNIKQSQKLQQVSDDSTNKDKDKVLSEESVEKLIETLMDVETLQCLKCLKSCSNKANLKAHIKTHFKIKPYICPICFKQFAKNGNMREHARVMHRFFGPFPDPDLAEMSIAIKDSDVLDLSMPIIQTESISNIKEQKISDADAEQMATDQASSSILQPIQFDESSLIDAENLQCKKCGKICSNKGNLKAHARLHLNLRPFTCPFCPKTFNKKSNMHFHASRMHTVKSLSADYIAAFDEGYCKDSLSENVSLGLDSHVTEPPLSACLNKNNTTEQVNEIKNEISASYGNGKQETTVSKEDTVQVKNSAVKEQGMDSETLKTYQTKHSDASCKSSKNHVKESCGVESAVAEAKKENKTQSNLNFETMAEELWGYNMQLQSSSIKEDVELNSMAVTKSKFHTKGTMNDPDHFSKQHNLDQKNLKDVSELCVESMVDNKEKMGLKNDQLESLSDCRLPVPGSSLEKKPISDLSGLEVLGNNPLADPNIVKLRFLMDEENLQCRGCFKKFANKWSLKAHVKAIHLQGKQYVCSVCNKSFNFKCNLERHFTVHFPNLGSKTMNISDFLKDQGSLVSGSTKDVGKNQTTTQREKREDSEDQNKETIQSVKEEIEKGGSGKTDSSFSDSESLKKVSGDSESPDIMSPKENDVSKLEMEGLMDLDFFQCRKCLKQFANKWSLKAHVRSIHIESRKYVCPVCSKSFNHKCNLDRHFVLHPSYVPKKEDDTSKWSEFQCFECKKSFANKWSMKAHIKSIHLYSRQYVCQFCQKSFNHKCNLDRHIVLHASGAYQMVDKLKPDDFPASQTNHSVTRNDENLNQDIDSSGASALSDMNTEPLTYDERLLMDLDKLKCIKCGKKCSKKSNLKTHVRLHLNIGHMCDICHKTFHNKEYLELHYKVHFPDAVTAFVDSMYRNDKPNDNIPYATNVIPDEETLKTEEDLPSVGSEQDGPIFCGLCGEKFHDRNALHEHFETHTGF